MVPCLFFALSSPAVEISFDDVDLSEAQKRIQRRIPKYIIKEWQDFLEKVA